MKHKRYLSKIFVLLISFLSILSCQQTSSSRSESLSDSLIVSDESSEVTSSESSEESSSEVDIRQYMVTNGNFESGDLAGWEVVKGDAFSDSDVVNLEMRHRCYL